MVNSDLAEDNDPQTEDSIDKLTYSFAHNSKYEVLDSTLPVFQPRTSSLDTPMHKLTEDFASMKISKPALSYGTWTSKQWKPLQPIQDNLVITIDSSDDQDQDQGSRCSGRYCSSPNPSSDSEKNKDPGQDS